PAPNNTEELSSLNDQTQKGPYQTVTETVTETKTTTTTITKTETKTKMSPTVALNTPHSFMPTLDQSHAVSRKRKAEETHGESSKKNKNSDEILDREKQDSVYLRQELSPEQLRNSPYDGAVTTRSVGTQTTDMDSPRPFLPFLHTDESLIRMKPPYQGGYIRFDSDTEEEAEAI
ncbi:hypothetical protein L13192_12737, partial [Pyrenophora tritici-repentis]